MAVSSPWNVACLTSSVQSVPQQSRGHVSTGYFCVESLYARDVGPNVPRVFNMVPSPECCVTFTRMGNGYPPVRPVFLVDDSLEIRELFALVASQEGVPLITAGHGVEALAKISQLGVDPAVLIVDLAMPVMDGRSFIKALRDRGLASSSPIVVYSGYQGILDELRPLGVEDLLDKSINLDSLRHILHKYVRIEAQPSVSPH